VKKIFITIFALTVVILTAVFVFLSQDNFESQDIELIKDKVESKDFLIKESIIANDAKQSRSITGLIVPHFDPVSNLTIDALQQVTSTPDLIILIGPNHHEAGSSPIITGSYISSKLSVRPVFAIEKMHTLAQMKVASYEDVTLSGDHSIGTPLPFIVQKFPNVPIIPIILKYHQSPEDIQNLLRALQKVSSSSTLIIASLDFSHYLSSDIAPIKDAQMQQYIETHDYKHIEGLSNDYIDSPWTLITFLRYLEANGVQNGRELAHTNTGQVAGQMIESSTSFFTYIY
jgi:AmmeMemoRadiSam system protein B